MSERLGFMIRWRVKGYLGINRREMNFIPCDLAAAPDKGLDAEVRPGTRLGSR